MSRKVETHVGELADTELAGLAQRVASMHYAISGLYSLARDDIETLCEYMEKNNVSPPTEILTLILSIENSANEMKKAFKDLVPTFIKEYGDA